MSDDLKTALDEHPEINWSEVARQSMWEYVKKLEVAEQIAEKSELTEAETVELGETLTREVAEHYRKDDG